MDLTLEVYGEKIVARDILRVGEHAQDMRPAWDHIAGQLRDYERDLFDSEGASGPNGKWDELADSTKAFKAANNLDPRIMHATLRLRESLTDSASNGDQEYISTPTFMVFGTKVPYGERHQGPGVQDQRRFLAFTELQKRDIVRAAQLWIIRGDLPA